MRKVLLPMWNDSAPEMSGGPWSRPDFSKKALPFYPNPKENAEERLAKPGQYNVIMLANRHVPNFLLEAMLQKQFHKSAECAQDIRIEASIIGAAIVGAYPHEVAEQRIVAAVAQIKAWGRKLDMDLDQV